MSFMTWKVACFLVLVLLEAGGVRCFALQSNKVVSKEEAAKLGVALRANRDGENGIRVWLDFSKKEQLKNFVRVELAIRDGEKNLVTAPLLASNPTPDTVSVYFSSDAANLPKSVLTIVV